MKARMTAVVAVLAVSMSVEAVKPGAAPDVLKKMIDCRAIVSSDQRLACYDQNVAAIDSAQKTKDIIVVSKAEVKEARRSLFGFQLPNFNLFGGGDKVDKADDLQELTTTVASASQLSNGDWSVRMVEGGTWETKSDLNFPPRSGDKVIIHKATLGSFLGRIGLNIGVRMRRVG